MRKQNKHQQFIFTILSSDRWNYFSTINSELCVGIFFIIHMLKRLFFILIMIFGSKFNLACTCELRKIKKNKENQFLMKYILFLVVIIIRKYLK